MPMMDSYKKQPISPVIFAKLNLFKVTFMFVNFDVTDQKNEIQNFTIASHLFSYFCALLYIILFIHPKISTKIKRT